MTFFGGGVVLLGAAACKRPAEQEAKPEKPPPVGDSPHGTFTGLELATMAAACERILPRDEDPGARDAHVPAYIDRMLQTPELKQMKTDFLQGLA
ncbi:MAG TPA: gluconate 2-dehydrogenase subunit 3 family protein, partial [Longimicrobium sp.]|nr:gluconate 2-dehydrogenase subunit 3 family protein [Longimicrobium sp.]